MKMTDKLAKELRVWPITYAEVINTRERDMRNMSLKESRMYVRFDYKCLKCGAVEDRFLKKTVMDSQRCTLLARGSFECGGEMVRLPAATPTTFKEADTKSTKRRKK
jgi:hypothetical protein